MSDVIAERIEFCKQIRPVKLVLSLGSPHLDWVMPPRTLMLFQLETTSGKILEAEGGPALVSADYEKWQRLVVITGINKRLSTLRIGVELLTPAVDPFGMIRLGWYRFKLHIPSCLPAGRFTHDSFQIHQSNFE